MNEYQIIYQDYNLTHKTIFDCNKLRKMGYINNPYKKKENYIFKNKKYLDWDLMKFNNRHSIDSYPIFLLNIRKLKIKKLLLNG